MSFFLVFLAIALVGAVVWAGAGAKSGVSWRGRPGGVRESGLFDSGFEQPVANLPPVLLPADAAPADVDRVRFSLGLRGYRMDQVDQVLDDLRDQLASKREEVDRLKARLSEAQHPPPNPAHPEQLPQGQDRGTSEGGA